MISSSLLEKEYGKICSEVHEAIQHAPNLSLQCDGWSNIRNESIVNFVISKPEPLFVEFLETNTNSHTAEYLSEEMGKIMDKYDAKNFFVVIGDNENTMQAALNLVELKYPWTVALGCVAHWLHLFCKDIMKCKNSKKLIRNAATTVNTIKRSHVLNAEFKNKQKEKGVTTSLKVTGKTRWGTILFVLESLQKNKGVLQSLAVDEASAMPQSVRKLMLSEAFWNQLQYAITIFKPIVSAVVLLEGDQPMIHKVHSVVNELVTTLNEIIESTKFFSSAERTRLKVQISTRKEKILKDIHLAAALLNPANLGCELGQDDKFTALEFIYNTGKNMNLNDTDLMADLANYQNKEGRWAKQFLWVSVNKVTPLVWWKTYGCSTDLGLVAIRILSAPISSAATERSFSTFGWIHSKKRNRLTTRRAGQLTYIAHNWRLLNMRKDTSKSDDDVEFASGVSDTGASVLSGGTGTILEESESEYESDLEIYSDLEASELDEEDPFEKFI